MELTILINPINSGTIAQSSVHTISQPIITVNGEEIQTQSGKAICTSEKIEYVLTQSTTEKYEFIGWYIDGTLVSTEDTYELTIYQDTTIEVRYKQLYCDIAITTNPKYMSISQTATRVAVGGSVTLRARNDRNYSFVQWSDGDTSNPRTIEGITQDIDLIAIYQKPTDKQDIYVYRCYVKEQLSLESKPKAFMKVKSFTIRNDLLAKANSTIYVDEVTSNVNNGDVITLYNPKGKQLYNGIITKIEDNKISCSQMQHFYSGKWVYYTSASSYLETEIYTILSNYAQGKMYNSTYTDSLVASRLGGITLAKVDSKQVNLPTKDDNSVVDMESFIYDLYNDYGVILDFNIAYSGTNTCTIKVPQYSSLKISNNNHIITDLSPTTSIEETNRLIVYARDGTYRKTYIMRTDGTVVEEPSSLALRFNITDTKIVFSDDDLSDLVASKLPSTPYNHKVTFTIKIKNYIYDLDSFKLGMPLQIFKGDTYFNSVLTAWEFSKNEGEELTSIKMTAGKVRTDLTTMLKLGKVGA
jgi:hypothetical protein